LTAPSPCMYMHDTIAFMATKTITIDIEAYGRLRRARRGDESFSQVIKRMIRPQPTAAEWQQIFRRSALSDEAIEGIERAVRSRRSPRNTGRRSGLR